MNQEQLFSLYEKLYFQELERREKLSARLNVPLAILVAVLGLLSFMLNNAPVGVSAWPSIFFWVFFLSASVATALGAWFFKSSWFGHTDKLLPTANETEDYRSQLIDLYKDFGEKEQLVEDALKKYLYDYYKQFSSENTVNNDARSYHLYQATYAITVAVLLAFLAFIPYFFVKQEGLKNGNQTAATTAAAATEKCEGQRSEVSSHTTSPKSEQTTKQVK
jgi:sterol desaturase/sphingolipid hydroxylase (fatty acid hydroxylase superfamily)